MATFFTYVERSSVHGAQFQRVWDFHSKLTWLACSSGDGARRGRSLRAYRTSPGFSSLSRPISHILKVLVGEQRFQSAKNDTVFQTGVVVQELTQGSDQRLILCISLDQVFKLPHPSSNLGMLV